MIRAATVADLWALRRKPHRRVFFYNDALLASGYHPYLLAVRGMLRPLGSRSDQITLVLRDHGLRGYLQARRRPNRTEIDLQFLASYGRSGRSRLSDGEIFYQLIEAMVKRAAQAQSHRVFAAIGSRAADVVEVLRQLGFQPYAQQSIWMLPEPIIEAGSAIVALRQQTRRDAWAVHQLYTSLTPRHVQQAEMRESASWQLAHRRPWSETERAWVLGDDQALLVHLYLRGGARGHVLAPMIAPHLRADAAAMARYVLTQVREQRPIFAVIRSYQGELGSALAELGFVERGEQTIFAKQVAIPQRQPALLPTLLGAEQPEGVMAVSPVATQKTNTCH